MYHFVHKTQNLIIKQLAWRQADENSHYNTVIYSVICEELYYLV